MDAAQYFLKKKSGFTLLEILLVVAAIAILAAIVIVAVNPSRQLGQTRNAERRSEINTILSAVYQYNIDMSGTFPATIPTDAQGDCPANDAGINSGVCDDGGACTNLVNLYSTLVGAGQTYITALPTDPTAYAGDDTGYDIVKNAAGRVTVCAPAAEQGAAISITR